MRLKHLTSFFLICVVVAFAGLAEAQQKQLRTPTTPPGPGIGGPSSLKTLPPGKQRFEACCESCPAGGCTGCNAYPDTPNLNCGSGLIKANCQVVNDEATCVKDDS